MFSPVETIRLRVERALAWSHPLHMSAIVSDEDRVLDRLYPKPLFRFLGPQKIKLTLLGDKRHAGLLFPMVFDPHRFLHAPINTMGIVNDLFESQTLESVIKSTFLPSDTQGVLLLGPTDIFTYKYQKPESEAWNVARAYKSMGKCLNVALKCSDLKILVLLPMSLSGRSELDLISAQGQALMLSTLKDSDFTSYIGSRIRFYSAPNYASNNMATFGGFEKLFRLTRTGEYLLSQTGSKEISFDISEFIVSWVMGQLPRVNLQLESAEHEIIKGVEESRIIHPFRPASALSDAAESFELQHMTLLPPLPRAHAPPHPRRGDNRDLTPRSSREIPPLMSSRPTGAGKGGPGKKHHQRTRPYAPGSRHQPWTHHY